MSRGTDDTMIGYPKPLLFKTCQNGFGHQNTPMSIGENQYGSWIFCNGNYQGLEKECLRSDMDSTKCVMFTSLFQGANNITHHSTLTFQLFEKKPGKPH